MPGYRYREYRQLPLPPGHPRACAPTASWRPEVRDHARHNPPPKSAATPCPRRSYPYCPHGGPSSRPPGRGRRDRSGSPGSRSCPWRTRPHPGSIPGSRRRSHERRAHPRGRERRGRWNAPSRRALLCRCLLSDETLQNGEETLLVFGSIGSEAGVHHLVT